jgi:hypothetical protein
LYVSSEETLLRKVCPIFPIISPLVMAFGCAVCLRTVCVVSLLRLVLLIDQQTGRYSRADAELVIPITAGRTASAAVITL